MNNSCSIVLISLAFAVGAVSCSKEERPPEPESLGEDGEENATFTIRDTADWNSAISAIKSGGHNRSYTLNIEGTIPVPPTTGVEQGNPATYTFGAGENLSVTVAGNGTLALSGKGFLICLSGKEGAKQTLIIDGPSLQGRSDNTVPLLRLDDADLELKAGKITGNTSNGGGSSGDGGGLYISRGVFTMSGGEISNNICGQTQYVADGGGVALSHSTFHMSGGTISGNTAGMGGGVYVGSGGSDFSMTGGIIKGNAAKRGVPYGSIPYGGGIYVYAHYSSDMSSFRKTGGIIYGSDVTDVDDKNRTINHDGTVYSNNGAAVYYAGSSVKLWENTLGESDNISTDDNVDEE